MHAVEIMLHPCTIYRTVTPRLSGSRAALESAGTFFTCGKKNYRLMYPAAVCLGRKTSVKPATTIPRVFRLDDALARLREVAGYHAVVCFLVSRALNWQWVLNPSCVGSPYHRGRTFWYSKLPPAKHGRHCVVRRRHIIASILRTLRSIPTPRVLFYHPPCSDYRGLLL